MKDGLRCGHCKKPLDETGKEHCTVYFKSGTMEAYHPKCDIVRQLKEGNERLKYENKGKKLVYIEPLPFAEQIAASEKSKK